MYIISNPINQDAFDRNIFKKSCNKLSNEIKKILIEKANHVNPFNLKDLHKIISLDKLNSYRLACFEEINNIPNLKRLIYQTVYPHILNLLGFDLAIQKNLNLSIQFPGDQSSILNKHQDFVSGVAISSSFHGGKDAVCVISRATFSSRGCYRGYEDWCGYL